MSRSTYLLTKAVSGGTAKWHEHRRKPTRTASLPVRERSPISTCENCGGPVLQEPLRSQWTCLVCDASAPI